MVADLSGITQKGTLLKHNLEADLHKVTHQQVIQMSFTASGMDVCAIHLAYVRTINFRGAIRR